MVKYKLIQNFIKFFIENNIKNNKLITKEYKYFITEFDDNNNISYKYSNLRENSSTYIKWTYLLYMLYKMKKESEKINHVQFMIKGYLTDHYYDKTIIKYDKNIDINNMHEMFVFSEKRINDLLEIKNEDTFTYKIYNNIENAKKQELELILIDYFSKIYKNI